MKRALQRVFWRNYAHTWAVKQWFLRKFSPAGLIIFGAAIVSAALGLDTNLNLGYQAFSFFAALLSLSLAFSLVPRPKFRAERTLPKLATAGQRLEYDVTVQNRGKRVERGYRLLEVPEDPRPTQEEFLSSREPLERKRNAFDRLLAYFRWMWLIARKTRRKSWETPLADIPPGEHRTTRVQLQPLRRGVLQLSGLRVVCPDPLGLFRTFLDIRSPAKILVLPKRYPIKPSPLPGMSQYQQGGVAYASAVGESEEFMSLRDYRRGDPLRHIHWKSLGKTGRLIVKEFQDEFFVRQALILDTFGPITDEARFEEAVSVAASLALTVQTQDSLLDLMFVGREAYCFTAGRGVGHVEQMLEILAAVEPTAGEPFKTLNDLVMDHAGTLSGCWCVLLSWDDERRQFIRELRGLGVPVCAIVIADASTEEQHSEEVHILPVGKVEAGLKKI